MRKIAVVVCLVLCVGLAGCKQAPQGVSLGAIPGAFIGSADAEAVEGVAVGASAIVSAPAGDGMQPVEMNKEINYLKNQLAAKEKAILASAADKVTLQAEINALKKQLADFY